MKYEVIIKVIKSLEDFITNHPERMRNEVSINIHLLNNKSYNAACEIRKRYFIWRKYGTERLAAYIFYQKYKNSEGFIIENEKGDKVSLKYITRADISSKRDWKRFYDFIKKS